MPRCLLLLLLVTYLTNAASISDKNNLTKLDCTYKDGRFGRIDLSSVGQKRGTPAFRHVLKDAYVYSYNPCYPFTEEDPCVDIAICQISKDGETYYVLGTNSKVSWSVSANGSVTLIYSTEQRQTMVNLVCSDQIDQLEINEEFALRQYNMTLFSKCACWNGC